MAKKMAQWRGQIPAELHHKLKVLAAQRQMTLGQIIVELLKKGLEKDNENILYQNTPPAVKV